MAQSGPGEPDYTIFGYGEEMIQSLMRRTATTNAAHLLPHLKPGQRILDVGCGPGNISVGLAQAVEPGTLYGIDQAESQVDLARAVAASQRQENVVFQVGDATALPFEDGFFDVVHCHDVLLHVADTRALLVEMLRTLKPGGVIGCREMIARSCFTYPDYGIINKCWEMFEDMMAADGGASADRQGTEGPVERCGIHRRPVHGVLRGVQRTGGFGLHLRGGDAVVPVAGNGGDGPAVRGYDGGVGGGHAGGLRTVEARPGCGVRTGPGRGGSLQALAGSVVPAPAGTMQRPHTRSS